MDDSARKYNMSIQYGMAYPRHALQTLEIQTVTQVIVIQVHTQNTICLYSMVWPTLNMYYKH